MISMASDVGRWPLIALRSIGHAERTTAQSIAAVNVTASPGRLIAGNQLRAASTGPSPGTDRNRSDCGC